MNSINCCKQMYDLGHKNEGLICILENIPFTRKPQPPTAYICSDGGYGGMEEIVFCPFCGVKILIVEEIP